MGAIVGGSAMWWEQGCLRVTRIRCSGGTRTRSFCFPFLFFRHFQEADENFRRLLWLLKLGSRCFPSLSPVPSRLEKTKSVFFVPLRATFSRFSSKTVTVLLQAHDHIPHRPLLRLRPSLFALHVLSRPLEQIVVEMNDAGEVGRSREAGVNDEGEEESESRRGGGGEDVDKSAEKGGSVDGLRRSREGGQEGRSV
jgi:hypothetical protein